MAEYIKITILCKWCYDTAMKRMIWVLLWTCCILGAVILRVYHLGDQSYWLDEAYSIQLAEAITEHGYPILDSGEIVWRSPLYHYMLAIPYKVFDDNEIAMRMLSVVFGLAAVLVVSMLAKQWFTTRAVYCTAVLMSFSYLQIAWSRQARMYMLLELCYWLTIVLFVRWLQRAKPGFPWWIIAAVATILSHEFGWFILPTLILLYWLQSKPLQRNTSLTFVITYVGYLACVVLGVTIGVHLLSYHGALVNYWQHYIHFIAEHYFLIVLLAAIGIWVYIQRTTQQYNILFLSGILLMGFGIFSYAVPLLHYRYVLFLMPALYILAAVALERISQVRWLGLPLVIICMIMLFATHLQWKPQTAYTLESDAPDSVFSYKSITPQPDFKSAYNFIEYKALEHEAPDILLTPYPFITSRYSSYQDSFVIPVDTLGSRPSVTGTEVYSGLPYLTLDTLKTITNTQHGIILLDTFATLRGDHEMISYITSEFEEIYTSEFNQWSRVHLYQF